MHQISLASFTEWSKQPVILDSNLVSLKCIQCSATVDLPGLNSLVSCACSLYVVSVSLSSIHLATFTWYAVHPEGCMANILVSTSVHYLWLKHEILIFLDTCWSRRYSCHPDQHPPPIEFYVHSTATTKVFVHWISTKRTTECCNGWWCELQQKAMDLYRKCTVMSLSSYQPINNGDMEVSKTLDMNTTFIRLFSANCNS